MTPGNGGGTDFGSVTMYFNGIQFDTPDAVAAAAVAVARCGYTLKRLQIVLIYGFSL